MDEQTRPPPVTTGTIAVGVALGIWLAAVLPAVLYAIWRMLGSVGK